MSEYSEFGAELEKHIRELVILKTKIQNCTGFGQDDVNSVSLLKIIIPTYNQLKKYPSTKLQSIPENDNSSVIIPSAPDVSQLLNEYDNHTVVGNKDIFSFENSDDELDHNIPSDDDSEIDVGNNTESRDAFIQHQNASILRLKHMKNTKWYSVKPTEECTSDEESDSDDDEYEDFDKAQAETIDEETKPLVQNDSTQQDTAQGNITPNNIVNQSNVVQQKQQNYNNSMHKINNEFKEVFGIKKEVCSPMCHLPSLEPLYCVG